MVHLTTASGSFHARVLAARLGADGILTELRGDAAGPYPLHHEVEVLVPVDDLDVARELLLVDDIEAPTDRLARPSARRAWVLVAVLVLLSFAALLSHAGGFLSR
jgi:hypothetical protein